MATIHRLSNGVTVLCEERNDLEYVDMQIHIRNGSANEADDEAGLTFLTQEATNGGTKTRTRAQIADDIESRGAIFSTVAFRTSTNFAANALARDAESVFDVLGDMIRNPAFDPNEVRKTQAQVLQHMQQLKQSAAKRKGQYYMEALFGEQAIARAPEGDETLVANFTPAQIRARHAELLADPSQIFVSFAGKIDAATAETLVARHFGDLPPAATPAAKIVPQFEGGDLREAEATKQLDLSLGFPASSPHDPLHFSYLMLQQLLAGGMSAPLFQEIREKRSLVYTVNAGYSHVNDAGIFTISAGTGEGNAGELIDVAVKLLGDFTRQPIPQADLDRARNQILRDLEGQMESARFVGGRNLSQMLTFGHIMSPEELDYKLKHVTSDSIRLACLQMLNSGKYAFSGVGPQDTMPTETEIRAMIAAQTANAPVLKPAVIPPVPLSVTFAAAQKPAIVPQPAQITTLPNGLRVVTAKRPGTLSMGAWTGVGADGETVAQDGASHMIEHMMFKGTRSFAPGEIDSIIENKLLGGLNAYTSKDRTAYYFYNMAAKDIEQITDICGEMVFEATISDDEYEGKTLTLPDGTLFEMKGERAVVLEEIKRSDDNVGNLLSRLTEETAYPNQPHARTVLGTAGSLLNMTAQDLRDYRDANYVPNNVIFAAVGDVEHQDFVDMIARKFGHLQPQPVAPLPPMQYQGGTAYEETPLTRMCIMRLTAEGVPANHPDFAAYDVLGDILAGGSSSRLHTKLVDELELTNGVGPFVMGLRNGGTFGFTTAVPAGNVRAATAAIYAGLREVAANVTQAELDKVINSNELILAKSTEENDNACRIHTSDALVFGAPRTAAAIVAELRQVTIADIKRVAAKILACNPTMTATVPPGTNPALLPTHAEIVAMRDGSGGTAPAARPTLQP